MHIILQGWFIVKFHGSHVVACKCILAQVKVVKTMETNSV